MDKKERRKVNIKNTKDVTLLGDITNKELLIESEKYDPENYNPLENINEKVMLVPENKSEIITIRVSYEENVLLKELANKNGISKSAFLRALLLKAIKEPKEVLSFEDDTTCGESLKGMLNNLLKKVDNVEKHVLKIDEYILR